MNFKGIFRPGRSGVGPLALVLTYGVGSWMVLLHHLEGHREQTQVPLLLHALRDSTLALPGVALAVLVATILVRGLLRRTPGATRGLELALTAALAAFGASAVFAAGVPLHERFFGGDEAHELPLALHLARDFLLALFAATPLAAAALLLPRPRFERLKSQRVPRAALLGLTAAFVAGIAGAAAGAPAGPGEPCPAGAPLKTFDVQAINVDIPLNRFGDHDPAGKMYVLSNRISDVRAQEANKKVSTGLHGDAIQPLVIRANEGDCVEISFRNNASGGDFGAHIDGLSFEVASSGDAVGQNVASGVGPNTSITYRYFIPDEAELEGAHYIRPGPTFRSAVSHGLFGVLSVEPKGSTYLDLTTGQPLESGWEASIVPGTGKAAFREFVQVYHEIGNEKEDVFDSSGMPLPTVDPFTGSYRPATRAMNYRSEPFGNRMRTNEKEEALGYASYTFGDPATPSMRGYQGDPTKIRLVHGGSEMFHVFHLHGGGIRWRFNPLADKTYDYADTGLNKRPNTQLSPSQRLDSQSFGPGETYNLEIEGGAGGVQQAAGDFLYHCHIASHYVSGMWAFWRVFDTLQPDMVPLPDRAALPKGVEAADLIGRTMPNGTVITPDNLDNWIRPQLPPSGVRKGVEDASVWNWTIDASDPARPVYLGEPEDKRPNADLPNLDAAHPGSLAVDLASGFNGGFVGERPKLLFNPTKGRPAYPLLRPHIGFRPPFSPNGHSGAPWLGENVDAAAKAAVDPYSGRRDGLCPAGSTTRKFNVVAITLPIRNTPRAVDPNGMIFTLAKNKDGVYAGTKPAEPLALRTNAGECDAVTLTSELTDAEAFTKFSKVNMHIHHVQFDVQASDGVITGMQFEQSVRPYKVEDPTLTAAAAAGATTLSLSSVAKFQPGVWIGIGLGTDDIEVKQIDSINAAASTVTLKEPLTKAHGTGQWAGVEFVQYRWYPDVLLDNIFWHDHVDGIHGWGHGLVGQLITEPAGSTYHDPKTGAEVDSGTIVDIHTNNPLAPGLVEGSFREFVVWEIDDNPSTDGTINLKAEPWSDRLNPLLGGNPDPSLLFSSYTQGDPITPLPRAYPKDPFVIRAINVGPTVDGLHIDGHRVFLENRYTDSGGLAASPLDTVPIGISERYTLALQGGAGGPNGEPGDYLYMNSIGRHLRQGAWGVIRVLPGKVDNLQPLPDRPAPANAATLPTRTGARPPAAAGAGNPCPVGANPRSFAVSAVDVPDSGGKAVRAAYVVPGLTPGIEPLVLHAAVGDCLTVNFTNRRSVRSSFHLGGGLLRTDESSGVNIGFSPENTVAPSGTRTYRYYIDNPKLESALITDFGGANALQITALDGTTVYDVDVDPALEGVYGALTIAPRGATFTDPFTGLEKNFGAQVDVHVAGTPGYRDFTLMFFEEDDRIGQSHMPYPVDVEGNALVNYGTNPRLDGAVSTQGSTPLLRAYAGDPVRVHAFAAPASEQLHSFNLGGLSFPIDPNIPQSEQVETRLLPPWGTVNAHIVGGAGGRNHSLGDFWYGDLRRPFALAGLNGIQRVLSPEGCPIKGLDGHPCAGTAPAPQPVASVTPASVDFGDQQVGTTSAVRQVTVQNTGGGALQVTNVAINGTNAADFSVAANGCGVGTFGTNESCQIDVTFTPGATGARSGTLVVSTNDTASSHSVALSGNGVAAPPAAPAVNLTPAALDFGNQAVGTTSAGKTVVLTNTGTAVLNVTSVGVAGTHAGDFSVPAGVCTGPLPPSATCTFSVTFAPTAIGLRNASVNVVSDAPGSPHTVTLTGTGFDAAPVVVLGEQTIKPSVDFNPAGMAEAFKYTATASGTLTQLKVYVDATSSATSVHVGLYSDNVGHPGTRLTSGTITNPVAGAWNSVTVTGVSVTSGTRYWIAMLGPSGAGTFRFRDACCGGGTPAETSAQTTLSGLPATWSSGTSFTDGPASAYGVAGSAAPPPPPPPPPPAATVLFGEQTILPSADSNGAGSAEAFQYTAATSGTLTSLKAYVDVPSLATRLVAGVYTDAAGHPGTLLSQGTLDFPVKGAWNTITVGSATITAGARYWIALLSPAGTGTLAFRDRCCGAAGPTETSLQSSLATLPATWSTGTVFRDGPASAYALG